MSFKFVLIGIFALVSVCHAGKGGKSATKSPPPEGTSPSNPINAAVISKQFFKVKDFPQSTVQVANIPAIMVNSGSMPIQIEFVSTSADMQISQRHTAAKPKTIVSKSVDGAIVLKHFVRKPIFQNIYETIVPRRNIVQEILPVNEIVKTIITQAQGQESTSAPVTNAPAPSNKNKSSSSNKANKKQTTTTTETPEEDTTSEEESSSTTEDSTTTGY